jgi:hypothetical protein
MVATSGNYHNFTILIIYFVLKFHCCLYFYIAISYLEFKIKILLNFYDVESLYYLNFPFVAKQFFNIMNIPEFSKRIQYYHHHQPL